MLKIKTLFLFLPLLAICCNYNTEIETNVGKIKITQQTNSPVATTNVSPSIELPNPLPSSYIACGCGCCPVQNPPKPIVTCLYHSKGDDIGEIIRKDRVHASNQRACATSGCNFRPIEYKYCD